ncbi:helix-turn-helix transcriptional regulator [Candidatus Avelusimicrobium fimicolum]|uniref:helix-turn-helix transcriptional regulator n=1 Tax=Candidatus Avelusimicrobium fimicolum TaxID=3416216 RepID=UPI003D12909F
MLKSATLHKFTRILYLLNKLDKGRITLTQEAKELGFSARTLQRDLHEIEHAGFPLAEISAGRYGFSEGFSLRKMPLSARDKALLALTGQLAESLGPNWHASFKRLTEQFVRPNPQDIYFIKMPRMWHSISPAMLEKLEQAILKHQYIDVYYKSQTKRAWSRQVRPLKIALFDGFWYLITLNSWNTFMKFSLGRIDQVRIHAQTFAPVAIDDKLAQSPNIWFDTEQNIEIKLKIAPSIAGYFKEVEFFPYQKIEKELKDGSLLISCKTSNIMQVLPQIKRWLPHIKVISPKELAQTLHGQLTQYLSTAFPTPGSR